MTLAPLSGWSLPPSRRRGEAGQLLEWVEGLRDDQLDHGLSPIVEKCLHRQIGIECPWGDENLGTYLQLPVEEINEKAGWDLRIVRWRHYSGKETRLLVLGESRIRVLPAHQAERSGSLSAAFRIEAISMCV